MTLNYLVTSESDPLLHVFGQTDDGKIQFGFGGVSKAKAMPQELLEREIEFRDYIMEGFISYFVKASRSESGLIVSIRKMGSNRDQHLDWFVEQYFESQGCRAVRAA